MTTMPSLTLRHRQPELMDDPALPAADHRQALAGLKRINSVSGSAGVLWPALRKLAAETKRPLRVLDLATGSGDVPLQLHRRAKRAGLAMEFVGCDSSLLAVEVAKEAAAGVPVKFFALDVLHDELPDDFDVFTCSLFLHHLDETDAVNLLRRVRLARPKLLLVNDLARGRLNYLLVWLASRLLSRSKVVHADATLSVEGAFNVAEMQAMAAEAGLGGAQVRTNFPCRMLLEWREQA